MLAAPGVSAGNELGQWRTTAPLAQGMSEFSGTAGGGKVYVAGGFLQPVHLQAQAAAFAYDPKTDRWTTLTPRPPGRRAFAAGTVGHVAYFPAGSPTAAIPARPNFWR
jgi:N-acetylneuraminic acid mutarotase